MFKKVLGYFSNAIGIDLGTANTLVYVKGEGIVLREPSVVAVDTTTGKALAVGNQAKKMLGRTPGNISAIRPMKDGAIADPAISEQMLRAFIEKVARKKFFARLDMLIAVAGGITESSRLILLESAKRAGADEVQTIPQPLASAYGVGLPVGEAAGSMIVDIGGGTTEVAVLSIDGIVRDASESIPIGGDEFDAAIINHVKNNYRVNIGPRTAEEIKLKIGSAETLDQELRHEARGNGSDGLPTSIYLTSEEVRDALKESLQRIREAVHRVLDKCPPELSGDILTRGIALAGGGSQLRNIDRYLSDATGVPVFVGDDPMDAVVNGTGIVIEEGQWLQGR